MKHEIDTLLKNDIIEPSSSPQVLIVNDGRHNKRLVIDYAPVLNQIRVFWPVGTSETAGKTLNLVLVSVSDCKRLETRSPWLRAWFK